MINTDIADRLRSCVAAARESEPKSIDARARCFVAGLAGAMHEAYPDLAAEVYTLLLNFDVKEVNRETL